jgi:hypothetical protein
MENGQKHLGKIFVPKKCSFILEHPVCKYGTGTIPAKAGTTVFAPFLVPRTQFHHGFLLVRQLFWLNKS